MLKNVKFEISSPSLELCPETSLSEIVVLGRSNVGKSTFINLLTGNSNLAKTSSTPGRTRLLNYFNVDKRYYLVDAPGYGYASISIHDDGGFATMMESYLSKRKQLKAAILLLDSRRIPNDDDCLMLKYLIDNNIRVILVATKFDKLNQSERTLCNRNILNKFNLPLSTPIIHSQTNKLFWIDEVVELLDDIIA